MHVKSRPSLSAGLLDAPVCPAVHDILPARFYPLSRTASGCSDTPRRSLWPSRTLGHKWPDAFSARALQRGVDIGVARPTSRSACIVNCVMEPDSPLSPFKLSFLSSLSLPGLPTTTAQHSYPHMAAFANVTAGAFLSSRAFWGPVTATLDWCEVSHSLTRVPAPSRPRAHFALSHHHRPAFAGKLSVLALHCRGRQHLLKSIHRCPCGVRLMAICFGETSTTISGGMDGVYTLPKVNCPQCEAERAMQIQGFALVGIGSFIFHATLLFEAQLMDELPMVYVASYCCAILFDTSHGFSFRDSNALRLSIIFIAFNALFTWS